MVQLASNEALVGDSDAKTALARPDRSSDPESSGALYSPSCQRISLAPKP